MKDLLIGLGFGDDTVKAPGIYAIVHDESEKVYIGSSENLHARLLQHKSDLRCNRCQNQPLGTTFAESPSVTIFTKPLGTAEMAHYAEGEMVKYLAETQPNALFNICIDDVHSRKGTTRGPEELLKWRESMIGHPVSEETRRKISEAHLGRKHGAEFCEKARARQLGVQHSEETREKMRLARAHTKREVTIDGKTYGSVQEAREQTGLGFGTIYKRATFSIPSH